jgi:5-methylcytosine-specific restriction protein A
MSTYLLTWNPKQFPFTDIHECIEQIRQDGKLELSWSTGSRKNMAPGDYLYLMRLGMNPRGIIGSGVAVNAIFQDDSWNESGQPANYVPADWHVLLDAESEPILDLATLKQAHPQFGWTPQGSGVRVPDDIADNLHALWSNFLAKHRPQHRAPLTSSHHMHKTAHDLELYMEGAKRDVVLSRSERSPEARALCLQIHGTQCSVCGFSFPEMYGEIGEGYIQVHHLDPISNAMDKRAVDPKNDLRPVCPNCHAMLHRQKPPYTIEELRTMLRR